MRATRQADTDQPDIELELSKNSSLMALYLRLSSWYFGVLQGRDRLPVLDVAIF